jgi:hypothetical protein
MLTEVTNSFCEQNTELLIVKAGGTFTYHSALKKQVQLKDLLSLYWNSLIVEDENTIFMKWFSLCQLKFRTTSERAFAWQYEFC